MVADLLSHPFHSVTLFRLSINNKLSFFNCKRYNAKVTLSPTKRKALIMAFDELLANNTNDDIKQSALLAQALKRQEYNRQYQAKLRQTTKLLTLEKKIDANLDHVLGYIKTRYGKEYAAWAKPVEVTKSVDPVFSNWLLASSKPQ